MPSVPASRVLLAIVAMVPCVLLLAPVALVILPLFAIAATARAIGRVLEPRFVPWADLMQFDSRLGWSPRARLDVHYLAEGDDVFHLETDDEGWPGRRSLDESDVVAVGDSFAFGYGIDTARSFAALTTGHRVKAVGAPGYSMVHGVRLMEQLGSRLKDKLVIWLVYLENDLQDNLAPEMRQYRAPFVRRDEHGWHIEDRHLSASPWTCSDLDRRRLFARFCVPGPLADRAYDAADYLIARAHASCQHAGARLVIVTVPHVSQLTLRGERELAVASGDPDRCDAGLPDRRLAQSCRRHGLLMVAGREHLGPGDYKRREGIHWNARGHRRVAGLISSLADTVRDEAGPGGVPAEALEVVRAMPGEARVFATGPK
jgi:hypothetical protein